MKNDSNVLSLSKKTVNNKMFDLPTIDLPFLEDEAKLQVSKQELVEYINYFSRNGRYTIPDGVLSNMQIDTLLANNMTLVKRIRDAVMAKSNSVNSTITKKAA